MNRTLRRPMFRMGGSANEGITSGLDTPKRGLVDGPGKYSQPNNPNKLHVVSCSRIESVKRLDILIESLIHLSTKRKDIKI